MCWTACGPGTGVPGEASGERLPGYVFYPPCGHPALAGKSGGGAYFVYVLTDSLQARDCVGPAKGANAERLVLEPVNEFLLAVDASPDGPVGLEGFTLRDSVLRVQVKPVMKGADGGVWKVRARGVKHVRLEAEGGVYAIVKGPAWIGHRSALEEIMENELGR
ncbi:hypothetical protein ACWKWU_06600 [Chitinophaga lutea]